MYHGLAPGAPRLQCHNLHVRPVFANVAGGGKWPRVVNPLTGTPNDRMRLEAALIPAIASTECSRYVRASRGEGWMKGRGLTGSLVVGNAYTLVAFHGVRLLLVSTIPARGRDFQTISLVGRVFSLRLVGRSSIKDELEYGNTSTKLKENNSGTVKVYLLFTGKHVKAYKVLRTTATTNIYEPLYLL